MGIFTGKVAIITGGGKAKSIGYGIAVAYAKEGSNLVLTGRNMQKLLDAKEELERLYGIQVLALQADITPDEASEDRVNEVVQETVKTFGRIDVLINNAQASASGIPIAMQTKDHFDLGIYSGLYATFYYMRACYPYLKQTQGSVINFASGAGLFGNTGQASYAAAKEGIRGLSRVAATEWGKDNINVNIVCPLAMTSQLENFKIAYPEAYEKNLRAVPMARFGDPEKDIGRVCVLLGSPDFKYMSGETLTLEGGMGQRP
nr:SDR family oxidoreductase [Maliibacterium massiliense]